MKPKTPKYWRSLAELEGDSEFQQFVQREFRSPTEQAPLSSKGRRRFMQLMGASFALSGCRWKEEKVLPHNQRPDGVIPGVPTHYATMMEIAGVATGLLVKSFDGRPIKVEGLPSDTVTAGGTGTYHQAAILGLYDPDRSAQVLQGGTPSSEKAFDSALLTAFADASKKSGQGFAILSGATTSPTVLRLRQELFTQAPQAQWVAYEPCAAAGPEKGSELAFGEPVQTVYHPEAADIVVALDSDLMSASSAGGLGYSRAIASRRDADSGQMSRIYAIEANLTEIGSMSDHRVAVAPSRIAAVASYIDAKVSAKKGESGAQKAPADAALGSHELKKVLDVLVKDLVAHSGASLVVVGSSQPPEVHALVARINQVLGNVGKTLTYHEAPEALSGGVDELASLVADMEGGKVDTLLVLGGNPVYDAPSDLNFAAALAKVKNSFHLGLYQDETAKKCAWHAPELHFLEDWADARALDGTIRLAQPLIDSILGGRSRLSVLAKLLGMAALDSQALVRKTHGLSDDKAFRKAVHDAALGSPAPEKKLQVQSLASLSLPKQAGLEVLFEVDPAVFDGRFANNGWLQELPHPLSKLAWDNAALVAPSTAKEHGLKDGHLCKVTLDGKSIELPCIFSPGQAEGTVALSLGYGRTEAGVVAGSTEQAVDAVGANAYAIRASKAPHFAAGAQIAKTGGRVEMAITQNLWAIDATGKSGEKAREDVLVRESTVVNYLDYKKQAHGAGAHGHKQPEHGAAHGASEHGASEHGAEAAQAGGHGAPHPGDIKGMVHHPPLLSLWEAPVSYEGHKWGMAIDLNKCSGCSACMVACQSENNISVVGKQEMAMGREMSWLRVERYYKGGADDAEVRQQPVMCQQCENAPCEQVCPVGATMHSFEGLNDMVYNRCIGTRYCSNNCPYKVRRFNYRNYNMEFYGVTPFTGTDDPDAKLQAMAFNPEVTVRSRGVMEKCTFCVQRIQNAKIPAKNEKRPIKDGEIKTACEQACATGAIVFGDLNDEHSRVAAAHEKSRAYELLQELNNRPRVNYLARIQNPHPELSTQDGHSEHH